MHYGQDDLGVLAGRLLFAFEAELFQGLERATAPVHVIDLLPRHAGGGWADGGRPSSWVRPTDS